MKLRYKLVISFTFICFASLSIFSGITITIYKDIIVKKQSNSMLENMYNYKSGLKQYLDVIDRATISLAYSSEIQNGISSNIDLLDSEKRLNVFKRINGKIKETLNTTYGIQGIYIEDNYNHIFRTDISETFTDSFINSNDAIKKKWHERTVRLKGASYWVIVDLSERKNTVALMRMINNVESGEPIAQCIVTVTKGNLGNLLPNGSDNAGIFCIIDQDGKIYNASGFGNVEDVVNVKRMGNGEGHYETSVANKEYVVTYTTDTALKWHFVYLIEKGRLFGDLNYVNKVWMIVFMLSFLTITLFSFFIASTISNPLTKLSGLIREVEKGNLKVKFNTLYNDEIGILGSSFNKMVKKIDDGIPLKREKLLRAILESNLDELEFGKLKEAFDIPFSNEYFQVVIFNAGKISETIGKHIENEIVEYESASFNIVSITLKTGQYCLISNHSSEETIKLVEDIIESVAKKVNVKIRAFLGNNYKELMFVKTSYEEAKVLMKYCFTETGSIYLSHDFMDRRSYQVAYPDNFENMLINNIEEGDVGKCRDTIRQLRAFLNENTTYPFIVNAFIGSIYSYIFKVLIKSGILPTNLYGDDCWEKANDYPEGALDDSFEELIRAIEIFINHIKAADSGRFLHPNIRKAIEIIGKEYHNPEIGIEYVSQKVYLHENYFCKLFKKETGASFVEYLSKIRMEKAKAMLNDTDIKIKDISMAVGFSDSHYFGIWFKENTGLTPSQFRKR